LKRRGFTREQIGDLRDAYKQIYKSGLTLEQAKDALAAAETAKPVSAEHLRRMRDFLSNSRRGIVR
jgi:UDP-N-acetylglucosamine acyltransferase